MISYDTRASAKPTEWTDPKIMGNRTMFRMTRDPSELIIKQVKVKNSNHFHHNSLCKTIESRRKSIILNSFILFGAEIENVNGSV